MNANPPGTDPESGATGAGDAGSGGGRPDATRTHIRGSALLLSGRLLALALNFFPQILIVRYLSKTDYGAFAFAFALTTYATTLASLGMQTAAARFIPIYEERDEPDRLLGSILFMATAMVGTGLAIAVIAVGCRGLLAGAFDESSASLALLLILIALVPVGALDHLLEALMAVVANARAIFLRRYILAPGLKLVAVVFVLLCRGDVYLLGFAHLVTGVLAVAVYTAYVIRIARARGWGRGLQLRDLRFPAVELSRFALPVLGSDVSLMLRGALLLVFLETTHGSTAVAEYRAVLPLAELNKVVMRNFGLLFIPLAARFYASGDRDRVDDLYWRNTAWIALLTMPVFAVSFSLARPLTVFLLEDRYASSALVLAVLAAAYYCHAMLGPNAAMLKVLGRVRYVLAVDVFATVLAVAGYALFVPGYGALGAAASMAASVVVHNVLIQVGLLQSGHVGGPHAGHLRLYGWSLSGTLVLFGIQRAWDPPLAVGVGLAAALSLLVARMGRDVLALEETFPELLRIPLVARLMRR